MPIRAIVAQAWPPNTGPSATSRHDAYHRGHDETDDHHNDHRGHNSIAIHDRSWPQSPDSSIVRYASRFSTASMAACTSVDPPILSASSSKSVASTHSPTCGSSSRLTIARPRVCMGSYTRRSILGILLPRVHANPPSGRPVVGEPSVHDAVDDLAIPFHRLVPQRVRHELAQVVPVVPLAVGHGRR